MVSNAQMTDAIKLSSQFEAENPGVQLKFITLPENQARAKITVSTSTASDQFDVVMISNYETPQWAANGWLTDLAPYIANTPGYDANDFIPSLREVLSHNGDMYSVPFYGESSFLMYRKDLFEQAGITVPAHPTWQQVAQWAQQFDNPNGEMTGICLRGKPGWGEVLAPLDTVINTFSGRWYDDQWNAQLTSPEVEKAVDFYVNLVRQHGEPGAATSGFQECATQFTQGKTAMWYDATSAVNTVEDPKTSTVAGKVGYASAPVAQTDYSGWLYTWSLGIPAASQHKDAAWKFISWMTNKQYLRTGYMRVSTVTQTLEQQQALEAAGVSKTFSDTMSGARADRPGFAELVAYVREGDTVVVWKLDGWAATCSTSWRRSKS